MSISPITDINGLEILQSKNITYISFILQGKTGLFAYAEKLLFIVTAKCYNYMKGNLILKKNLILKSPVSHSSFPSGKRKEQRTTDNSFPNKNHVHFFLSFKDRRSTELICPKNPLLMMDEED